MIVNDLEITDELEIANHFNNYFSNIATSLNDQIPHCGTNPDDTMNTNFLNSFYCRPTENNEIINIILNFKKSRSNINVMPVTIMQRVADIISIPLSIIINYSFSTGKFPSALKEYAIVPIYKKGERTDVGNYRPIAILPTLSKILEKCMVSRINNYINKFSIISSNQFGFTKNTSTLDAIEVFSDLIYNSFDSKLHNISLFIDLRKAFDTVNHKILLYKLESYGIRGPVLSWIKSYLKDRKQCVKIGSSYSNMNVINIGLPQGSSISPILFLLYINDLVNVSDLFNVLLFADDTTLCASGVNFSELVDSVNSELNKISDWMASNRLSLNIDKTCAIISSNCDYNIIINPIVFNSNLVTIEPYAKFLGLFVDSDLNFKKHISYVCNKLSKTIGILHKLKHFVPRDIMIKLYYSLAYPYFTYCNVVWGNTFPSHVKSLITLQKKLIRIITNSDYLDHTTPLFKLTDILPLDKLHSYLLAVHMFKKLSVNSSQYAVNHNYSTRKRSNIPVPFHRLSVSQHSVSYACANVWNLLPISIRNCQNIQKFKRDLKNHFISSLT